MRASLILALFLTACNNSVPSRTDVVVSGTAKAEVTVSMEFLNQLKILCEDLYASVPFEQETQRRSAVATCVFDHMKNLGTAGSSVQDACNTGQIPADVCKALGDL